MWRRKIALHHRNEPENHQILSRNRGFDTVVEQTAQRPQFPEDFTQKSLGKPFNSFERRFRWFTSYFQTLSKITRKCSICKSLFTVFMAGFSQKNGLLGLHPVLTVRRDVKSIFEKLPKISKQCAPAWSSVFFENLFFETSFRQFSSLSLCQNRILRFNRQVRDIAPEYNLSVLRHF